MLKFLAEFEEVFGPLRVFDSITFRAALALVSAFLLTLLSGQAFIVALQGLRVLEDSGNPDSVQLSHLHQAKRHTPTMGGIMMIIAVLLSTFLFADPFNHYVVTGLFTLLSFAGVGMVDDVIKLRGLSRHRGLSRTTKILAQVLLAGIIGTALWQVGDERHLTRLVVPGVPIAEFLPDLGLLYYPFFILVLIGSSNAVNLTDGLDGLAAGCTALVAATFAVLAYAVGHAGLAGYLLIPHVTHSGELTIFCAALTGATLGFLWYNAHPARIFMGDTGSLALGASIGFVALAVKQELVLLLAGGIFVWEALSVILQIASCKFRGRRVFRCAPFHHHLEFSGWNENHVVVRLWLIGIMLAALGVATLKMH
jgi:phospho-N-acetylmuramoyl-pentapeptide-transferase